MAIAGKVAILPKGEWDSAVTYEKLDVVSYNNALYMAKKPSVGQVPTDGEYWMFCLQSIDYAEFEKIINGTTTVGIADKAINDKNGDDIVDAYAKKDDLTNFQNKDGDSKDNTVTFESSDASTADAWTDVAVLATGEKHSSLFAKISTMFKNIRYIYTHFIKSENILETLEEVVANTQSGKVAGALAVKELNSNLGNIGNISILMQNGYATGNNIDILDLSQYRMITFIAVWDGAQFVNMYTIPYSVFMSFMGGVMVLKVSNEHAIEIRPVDNTHINLKCSSTYLKLRIYGIK